MFSRRVNTVIKTANYFTLTFELIIQLSLPCLFTQYFAIGNNKTNHAPFDTSIHVYYGDTCEIPSLQSARLNKGGTHEVLF